MKIGIHFMKYLSMYGQWVIIGAWFFPLYDLWYKYSMVFQIMLVILAFICIVLTTKITHFLLSQFWCLKIKIWDIGLILMCLAIGLNCGGSFLEISKIIGILPEFLFILLLTGWIMIAILSLTTGSKLRNSILDAYIDSLQLKKGR